MYKKIVLILAGLLFFASTVNAQNKAESTAEKKEKQSVEGEKKSDEVIVRGEAFIINKTPFTLNTVTSGEIKKKKISKAAEIVLEVPGVEVKKYNQGGVSNAISMRGFTTGFHSGDTAAYLDVMALNEFYGASGGQSNPNVIVPLEIDKVEVFKGPSSVLYGNFAKSGTVVYTTKKRGEYNDILASYGSNSTMDFQGAIGHQMGEKSWNNTSFQLYKTDGYTAKSDELYGTAATSFTWDIGNNTELNASLRAHRDIWNIAGYMTKTEYDTLDRYSFVNGKYDGGDRGFYSASGSVSHRLNNLSAVEVNGYSFKSDFRRYYSSSSSSQQTETIRDVVKAGGSAKYVYSGDLFTVTAGTDYSFNSCKSPIYNTANRVRTLKKSDLDAELNSYGLFADAALNIHRLFRPSIGARYDVMTGDYDYTDYVTSSKSSDGSLSAPDYDHISPKIGFTSEIIEGLMILRGSVSSGFVLPLSAMYYEKVKVSNIWQYDAGIVISLSWFMIDLGGFVLDTTNEVKENPSGSGNYEATGKTRRYGFESAVKVKPFNWIDIYGKFSWINSEILENADQTVVSKSISGIPKTSGNIGFMAESPWGIGCKGRYSHTGKYYLNDQNSDEYSGFNLLDLGLFYKFGKDSEEREITFEIKNALDKRYASSASGTSWSPGEPRTFTLTYAMKW